MSNMCYETKISQGTGTESKRPLLFQRGGKTGQETQGHKLSIKSWGKASKAQKFMYNPWSISQLGPFPISSQLNSFQFRVVTLETECKALFNKTINLKSCFLW